MTAPVPFELVRQAADDVGTPFFVYHNDEVRERLRVLSDGLKLWGRGRVAYSVKTNPLRALLRDVQAEGAWAEVVSDDEYAHARGAGFAPSGIVYNGPLKAGGVDPEALACALVNVDGLEEIDVLDQAAATLGRPVRVGLRVCPPKVGPSWSRFGLSIEAGEFDDALRQISNSRHLTLSGLHMHLGTQVKGVDPYKRSVSVLREVWQESGLSPHNTLDIGGGFAFAHDGSGEDDWLSFFDEIASLWPEPRPFLLVEPGRVVAGPALTLVCRVLARKERPGEPAIIVTDGGTNHNVMGAFFEHGWSFECTDEVARYRMCGPLCMEDDVMSGERHGPLPRRRTLAQMANAGAYSLTLARSFIQPAPPVVQISPEGDVKMLLARVDYSRTYGGVAGIAAPA